MAKKSGDFEEQSSTPIVAINIKDIAGLSSPLEKLASIFGEWSKPWLTKKMADSRAYEIEKTSSAVYNARRKLGQADFTQGGLKLITPSGPTKSSIGADQLLRRAERRLAFKVAKEQKNIESILFTTAKQLASEKLISNQVVDDEWASRFLNSAGSVSDEEMQQLWAKILAGEVKKPGSYSKRTVECVSLMERNDALSFANLCRFRCSYEDSYPLVLDYADSFYTSRGINFKVLLHLANLGLITLGRQQRFKKIVPKNIVVEYYTTKTYLTFKKLNKNEFDVGQVMFAQIGLELSQICDDEPIAEFVPYLLEKWRASGIGVRVKKGKISAPRGS